MKLAGGAHLELIDPEAFLAQAAEYEAAGDLRDGVLKLLNTEKSTHPFAVVRAAELRRWVESGDYDRILRGDYPLRAEDHAQTFSAAARDAARSYRKRMEESTDPLVGAVRGFGATVGSAADGIADWVNRRGRPSADSSSDPDDGAATDPAADSDSAADPDSAS